MYTSRDLILQFHKPYSTAYNRSNITYFGATSKHIQKKAAIQKDAAFFV